jgi:hypothetical protein
VSPARILALLALLGARVGAAQEAPAHLPMCVTDSAARHFEDQVRYLLSPGDPAAESRLRGQGLTPARGEAISLVSEERVCVLASTGYAEALESGLDPPFAVAVVRVPGALLVELIGKPGIVVLDDNFRPLARLATGSGTAGGPP